MTKRKASQKDNGTICLLFGAGASFGSGACRPRAPPLGKDVAQALEQAFPKDWAQLPGSARTALQDNFEEATADLIASKSHAATIVLRMSGVLFSNYYPERGNAYRRLAAEVAKRGSVANIATATLNYDCLWELAVVEETGLPIDYFGNAGGVAVLKPHGSCNFRNPAMRATKGVAWTPGGVVFEGPLEAIDPRMAARSIVSNEIPPAMAFYETNKAVPVCKGEIEKIQRRWSELAGKANRIAVIGVQPNEHDKHIFAPMADSAADLFVVGPSATKKAWKEVGVNQPRVKTLRAGFSGAVDAVADFLGSA